MLHFVQSHKAEHREEPILKTKVLSISIAITLGSAAALELAAVPLLHHQVSLIPVIRSGTGATGLTASAHESSGQGTSRNPLALATNTSSASMNSTESSTSGYQTIVTSIATLPPGVKYDSRLTPLVSLTTDYQSKLEAVLQIAKSKLGQAYQLDHNEDRGQVGFDCSNYTAYVFHHALGYKFSSASRIQASSVGEPVQSSDMRPGDLLIFEDGAHVGIYLGNEKMIEDGGGLGKVGYLSVKPGSYWGNHLTGVKRLF